MKDILLQDEPGFVIIWVHAPAYYHELPLSRSGSESLPHVHGENGAGAVEDGGQGGHEGSDHHSHHQTSQPWNGGRNGE